MIWALIKDILTGGIGKLAQSYRDIKIAEIKEKGNVTNTVKELELKRLEAEETARQTSKEIRLATKDYWEVRFAIGLVAIPSSLHYAFTAFESIYGFGWNIQPLPEPLNEWQGIIILSYFGYGTIRHGTNVIAMLLKRGK